MIMTEDEQRLEELQEIVDKIGSSSEQGVIYSPEKPKDDDKRRLGYPKEMWSIMG